MGTVCAVDAVDSQVFLSLWILDFQETCVLPGVFDCVEEINVLCKDVDSSKIRISHCLVDQSHCRVERSFTIINPIRNVKSQ